MSLSRRRLLAAGLGLPLAAAGWRTLDSLLPAASAAGMDRLVVTCASAREIAIVDPDTGMLDLIEVGAAPHGLALHPDGRAFVATADGVAVLDLARQQRTALVPYSVDVGPPRVGEYRPGGMGIAVTPDGSRVAVAVYRAGAPSLLDKVIGLYLTNSQTLIEKLHAALAGGDRDGARQAAHALASSSGNVGAMNLASLCRQFESASAGAEQSALRQLGGELGREHVRVVQALREVSAAA